MHSERWSRQPIASSVPACTCGLWPGSPVSTVVDRNRVYGILSATVAGSARTEPRILEPHRAEAVLISGTGAPLAMQHKREKSLPSRS